MEALNGVQERPTSTEDYLKWLKEAHDIVIDDRTKNQYASASNAIKLQFEASPFWQEVTTNLKTYHDLYQVETQYPLFPGSEPFAAPKLDVKSLKSMISKSYRMNIVHNGKWNNPPVGGWVLPNQWYSRINDIVRTTFVVKYLDGVQFLVDRFKEAADKHDVHFIHSLEARREGHYAAHILTTHTFEIAGPDWGTEKVNVQIEFQITTQVKELIYQLTHKYYEERRERIGREQAGNWEWNYLSEEFVPNSLGHILHYIEAMIMEVREKQRGKDQNHG